MLFNFILNRLRWGGGDASHLNELLADDPYPPARGPGDRVQLNAYGYRWFRIGREAEG